MLYRIFIFCLLCTASLVNGQISIDNSSFTYTQDFNTLANTGTSSSVPAGWAFSESGSNSNTTYAASTGSDNAGNTYSFGLGGNSERAFGGLLSGSLTPTIGVCFTNNTTQTIHSVSVAYTGETWRIGTINRSDGLQFEYNVNTTGITGGGTWVLHPALDYFNPGQSPVGGGSMVHSANISNTITGLNIATANTFCFRWIDFNASGSDDGMGVDDFMITSIVLPVKFTNVSAKSLDKEVLVQFGTATEINNDFFTIERSSDGIHFVELDRIKGQGNSSRLTEYEFFDRTPFSGNNFYRIKQTDYDGESAYSQVVSASTVRTDYVVEVFSDGQKLSLNSPEDIQSVTLFDLNGAQVFHKNADTPTLEIYHTVNTPGLYIVMVKTSGQTYQKLVWMM